MSDSDTPMIDPPASEPKKAPARRRASRKTPLDAEPAAAAASPTGPQTPPADTTASQAEVAAEVQTGHPVAAGDAPQELKKAPRRAARPRKAPAVGPQSSDNDSIDPPAQAEVAAVEAEPVKQPAKRAPRRRPAKAISPVEETVRAGEPADAEALANADDAANADEAAADVSSDVASSPTLAVFAPPVVLFQAPTEVAEATPRRRPTRSRKPVVEFVDVLPELPDDEELDAVLLDVAVEAEADEAAQPTEPIDESAETDDAELAEEGSEAGSGRRRRRRGRRGRGSRSGEDAASTDEEDVPAGRQVRSPGRGQGAVDGPEPDDSVEAAEEDAEDDDARTPDEVAEAALSASARRRRRRRRSAGAGDADAADDDPPNTVVHVRETKGGRPAAESDGVRGVKGSTRLEAKRQRRRDTRDSGRKRAPILTEAEFLARRESVDRVMAVRDQADRTQIAVLEDGILVEHYVTRAAASSAVGNVYLGRVQNVLPSMEAAFVDIGRGRNGVLYAGEVNWDSARLEGKARAIENALSSGDTVLVQVTKDPIGHKGARLTSQISLPGRYVVYIPGGGMTGISRKLPDVERSRLKSILKKVVPDEAGVIVRTAAEGAAEADLISDVERLKAQWELIAAKAAEPSNSPSLVYGEPDLAIRVVRDVFNEDFSRLVVSGSETHSMLTDYLADIAPELNERVSAYVGTGDLFADLQIDEQLAKALDRKVWLPSGGSLVIDRTEAMTVVDVNTGKYTGSGGNLEQTVTRNNLEAAEELVRQLRLRDIGGIVVIDFIDMVLESNRELVLRRLTECLGRDRTKHQVAEVTSLGLIQMTRKRVGEGLLEAFSEPCERCQGRGLIVHTTPVSVRTDIDSPPEPFDDRGSRGRPGANRRRGPAAVESEPEVEPIGQAQRRAAAAAIAAIAAATSGTGRDEVADVPAPDQATQAPDQAAQAPDEAAQAPDEAAQTPDEATQAPDEAAQAPDEAATQEAAAHGVGGRPRRRRAASRPAGPPVIIDEPVHTGVGV